MLRGAPTNSVDRSRRSSTFALGRSRGLAICNPVFVDVQVLPAGPGDKPVVRRLLELYRYDFSEFDGSDLDEHGEYGYLYLDVYWTEPDRRPFLLRVDGKWAGFALVRTGPPLDMAEFFVLRKYRRSGVGRRTAMALFGMFPGTWTVRQQLSNPSATVFWRSVIPFRYSERTTNREVIQEFTAP
jgi:predicted acetyltransferase